MSLGNLVAVVFGLAFGGALLMLSPAKAGAAMVGLAAAVTILRFPFWGLLLFALVATFMPYSTVNVGIRSTVSEAILALTWGAVLWHIFLSRLPPAPALRYRSTERMLLWLMLFTVLPFVVGQVSIKAEASGLSNWLRWLLNLSIVFLAGRLLVERKNRETLVIALLLGTLAMLLMSIAVFIRYRSASGMAPILAMFNYANLDTLKFGLEALSSRMGSPWMHPNATGGIMALLLPLAFCYGVANQGWRRGLGLAASCVLLAVQLGLGILFLKTFWQIPVEFGGEQYLLPGLPFSLDITLISSAHFMFGYVLRDVLRRHQSSLLTLCIALAVTTASFLYYPTVVDMAQRRYDHWFWATVQAVSGVYLCWALSGLMMKIDWLGKAMTYIGQSTLILLIFHGEIQHKTFNLLVHLGLSEPAAASVALVISVIVSLLIGEVIKRVALLRALYFPFPVRKKAAAVQGGGEAR
ncbi:acyltransferase family protein [Pseudomonas aeruginosa]